MALGFVVQHEMRAPRFAVARAVEYQTRHAAHAQIGPALKSWISLVTSNPSSSMTGPLPARAEAGCACTRMPGRLARHGTSAARCAAAARALPLPECLHAAHVSRLARLGLRMHEALANMVVIAARRRYAAAVTPWPFAACARGRSSPGARLRRPFVEHAHRRRRPDRGAAVLRCTSSISAPPHGAPPSAINRPCDQR